MKYNLVLLVVILIGAYLCGSCFAADVNETNLSLDNEIVDSTPLSPNTLNSVDLSENNSEISNNPILEESNDDANHIYVSPNGTGDGSINSPTSFSNALTINNETTVIHLNEGIYSLGTVSIKQGIHLISDNPGKAIFKDTILRFDGKNSYPIVIDGCSFINYTYYSVNPYCIYLATNINTTIKNCYFLNNSRGTILHANVIVVSNKKGYLSSSTFNLYNCTFENNNVTDYIIGEETPSSSLYYNITKCKFINNNAKKNDIYISHQQSKEPNPAGVYISDCIFEENNSSSIYIYKLANGGLYLENNILSSNQVFEFETGNMDGVLNSLTTLTISEVNLTAGSKCNISCTLVDDMGNVINSPNLKLTINDQSYSTSFVDGVYLVEYTVPDTTNPVQITDFTCSNINKLICDFEEVNLLVKSALKMNASDISDADYGENITICVNISNMESGSLTYEFIKNNEVVKTLVDSFANNVSTVNINDLSAGDYTVNIKYLEDQNFGATTITKTFTVNKANATLQLNINQEIPVFDNITVQAVILPATAGGNVTFKIKGENQTIIIVGGVAEAIFDGLGEGNYTVFAIYNGDDNYNPSIEYNATFNVVKVNSTLGVEHTSIVPGENVDIIITLDKDINDNVTITVNNGEPISRKLTNGTLTYTIENIALGSYNVTVSFEGNEKYFGNEASTLFTVERLESNLNISAANVDWENPVVVSVSTDERFSGDVEVSIGDRTEIAHVVNGSGEATFTNLAAETYTVTAKLNETGVFNADEKNTTVTVNKVASELSLSNDLVFDYGSSNTTTATFAGAVNITAVVVEDSNANVVADGNVITVSGLNAGNYTLKVTTNPDENHTEVSATVNITVNKVNSFIDIRNEISYDYGGIGQCDVFTEGAVNFTARIVNHTEAIITISPISIVNVSGLDVGKYVLEVTTNPDKNHLSVTSSVNVTVNVVDSQITIPNIVFDYGASGSATVTLVGATGINASVLNHPEAVVKVVNNTITVSGLAAGSYVLQATTIPDANHDPVTTTSNITVNMLATSVSGTTVTFTYGDSKNMVITLKDKNNQVLAGKDVVVVLNNVKYPVKTDAKGQATIKVPANLVPKIYTASITFAGDGNYIKSTNTAKVTVNKAASKITAKKATFKAKKKTKKYTITLKAGKKAISKVKVTIKIGKKTFKATTNNKGKATFKITKLVKKAKYNAVVKFAGNKYYKASSKKVKIILK